MVRYGIGMDTNAMESYCPRTQVVAKALGIRAHKVVCKTKRLGGGFGGKETRAIIANLAAAVGAYHTGKPVSVVMDRDEDMQITGQRHAYVTKYKV